MYIDAGFAMLDDHPLLQLNAMRFLATKQSTERMLISNPTIAKANSLEFVMSSNGTLPSITQQGFEALSIDPDMTIAAPSLTFTSGMDTDGTYVRGNINGSGTLVKSGSGDLWLMGLNSYEGGTVINGGKLSVYGGSPHYDGGLSGLPVGKDVTINAGTLELASANSTIGNLRLGNGSTAPIRVFGSRPFDSPVLPLATLTINGDIIRDSTGLAPTARIDAKLVLSAGNHNLHSATSTVFFAGYDFILSEVISGEGGLTKTGQSIAAFGAANTYTGPTVVAGGVLYLGATNSLSPTSAVTVNAGAALSFNPTFTALGVTAGNYNQSLGSLSGAGSVFLGSANLTIGTDNRDTTFTGRIITGRTDGSNASLTKVGTGTLSLSLSEVPDIYGLIEVQGGTLAVNTYLGNMENAFVRSGGALAGGGYLPTVYLNAGGAISPGNGAGTLGTLSGEGLVWDGGGVLRFDLVGANASDRLDLLGGVLRKGDPEGGLFLFDFTALGFPVNKEGEYTLVRFGSTDFLADDFSYRGLPSGVTGRFELTSNTLTFRTGAVAVVPESGTGLLLLSAATVLGAYGLIRRK
jgi:autotransporter-associated beta strand protein